MESIFGQAFTSECFLTKERRRNAFQNTRRTKKAMMIADRDTARSGSALFLVQRRASETYRGRLPKPSTNFHEIFSRAHGNFENKNKVLKSSTIINQCIIIIIIIFLIKVASVNVIRNKMGGCYNFRFQKKTVKPFV